MQVIRNVALLTLLALSTACTEESVADKYLSGGAAAQESTTPDPDPVDPDPDTGEPAPDEGDAALGEMNLTSLCKTCHGAAGTTVLDKTAIDKLDNAATLPNHASFKEIFEGADRLNLEAALKTK